jgi:hypothetical protein
MNLSTHQQLDSSPLKRSYSASCWRGGGDLAVGGLEQIHSNSVTSCVYLDLKGDELMRSGENYILNFSLGLFNNDPNSSRYAVLTAGAQPEFSLEWGRGPTLRLNII